MTALDIDRIRRAFLARTIEYYAAIDSTMHPAAKLETGGVAIADEQTAGQGRLGRGWHSEAGAGIYCSIVLKPVPVLMLALGLAAQRAIFTATGLECDIRWPNDLMLGGKKVAGMLAQVAGDRAVAGIGINVNQTEFPPKLQAEATSLRLECGRPPGFRSAALQALPTLSRESILIALLPAVDDFVRLERDEVLRLFAQGSSYASGRRVTFEALGRTVEGTTAGLDPSGFLIVRKDNGTDTLVLAGGVRAVSS